MISIFFFEFIKFRFMAQDVIYPGEGSMSKMTPPFFLAESKEELKSLLMKVKLLSPVRLLATPWTAVYQAPPPMGFARQEYWSGCHCLLCASTP